MSRPWMPLYPGDYLADTAHLSAAESGAYLHLIMHYWLKGGLPDDDAQLARIARMTPAEWQEARPVVEAFFNPGWKHGRIDHELAEAERLSGAGRAGGIASGKARRQRSANDRSTVDERSFNDVPNDLPTTDERHANDPPTKCEAPPSQSQDSPSLRSVESGVRKGARLPPDWRPTQADLNFAICHLTESQISNEIDKFRDFWHARAGPNARKVDWSATWRNWVRREAENVPKLRVKSDGKRTIHQAADDLLHRLRALDEPAPGDVCDGAGEAPVRMLSQG